MLHTLKQLFNHWLVVHASKVDIKNDELIVYFNRSSIVIGRRLIDAAIQYNPIGLASEVVDGYIMTPTGKNRLFDIRRHAPALKSRFVVLMGVEPVCCGVYKATYKLSLTALLMMAVKVEEPTRDNDG